jgi:DNA-binding transcriptional ArsR family regulator
MADATRLQMVLLLLRHEELCVCDFVQVLAITQSKASRHLRYLAHAGLLEDRRDGVWMHYRITATLDKECRQLLEATNNLSNPHEVSALEAKLQLWYKQKNGTFQCATK